MTNTSRRGFVAGGAVAALGFPMIARAQTPIAWRFQSSWPAKAIFHEFAVDFCRRAEEIADGRLKITMLPAGAVVPGLGILDAVSKGTLDGGHGVPGFWFGKNTAFGLYGAGPNFAMTANQLLGWIEYGGGRALYEEVQKAAQVDVVSLLHGPVPTEPLGWFKKEVKTVADFKGLKFRTAGLAVDLMRELGAAPVQLAPGEIVPSIDRGVLDAAEFANATDDRIMGFPDVAKFYYQQSYHMANNVFEIMINKPKYDALPAEVKLALKLAGNAVSAEATWKSMDRMSTDLIEMQRQQKVRVIRTPQAVLTAQLGAWDKVIERRSGENPLFAKIVESQKAWARRVVYWDDTVTVGARAAYNHYFKDGARV
jgi:TRAP-type mannitol/chloroaromatic compound transport system substrate-binding protein